MDVGDKALETGPRIQLMDLEASRGGKERRVFGEPEVVHLPAAAAGTEGLGERGVLGDCADLPDDIVAWNQPGQQAVQAVQSGAQLRID